MSRRRPSRFLPLLLVGLLAASPGCATLTGLATGAFTGAVDAPAQVYRYNRGELDRHPEWWIANLLLFVPVGIAAGPIVGMVKGVALDVEWLLDQVSYEKVFQSYREPSVWRPFTMHW